MRQDSIYGSALLGSALVMLAMGVSHPTGAELMQSRETFAHVAFVNTLAHSLAMLGAWLALFGLTGLSRRLGMQRADVTAALIAFGLASVAVILAAVLDGLVVPKLAGRLFVAGEALQHDLRQQIRFCVTLAIALTRFYVVAVAVAMLLWSWAAFRTGFARVLPWVGAAIAGIGLAAQLGGFLEMNVHDLLMMVLAQSVWTVWAGIVMIRNAE